MNRRCPRTRCGTLITLLTLVPLPAHVFPPGLSATPSPAGPDAGLRQGIASCEGLDYEQGVLHLEKFLAGEGLTASRRKEALLYLALCQASLGRNEQARGSFVQLLEIEPGFRLDTQSTSPKILELFDLAREDFQNSIRSRDNLPPTLQVGGDPPSADPQAAGHPGRADTR